MSASLTKVGIEGGKNPYRAVFAKFDDDSFLVVWAELPNQGESFLGFYAVVVVDLVHEVVSLVVNRDSFRSDLATREE